MTFEYKTVGAPEKGKRKRGAHSRSDRVAAAFGEVLQAEAVDGWEYLRTDLVPVTERASWFGRRHEIHRAVLVFRRPLERAQPDRGELPDLQTDIVPPQPSPATPAPTSTPRPEPAVSDDPELRLTEVVKAPGPPKPED